MAPEWKKQAKASAAAKAAQSRNTAGGGAAAKKPPLTHFLCVPLVTAASRPVLEQSLAYFREEAAKVGGEEVRSAIDGGAVRPAGTLHLTLGVMSLMAEGAVQEAVRVLQECDFEELLHAGTKQKEQIPATSGDGVGVKQADDGPQEQKPLVVTLESLHAMRSPLNTSVLYAAPRDASQRLLPFCERLKALFIERGLMLDENRPLKLHVSVLNTIYAKPGGRQGSTNKTALRGPATETHGLLKEESKVVATKADESKNADAVGEFEEQNEDDQENVAEENDSQAHSRAGRKRDWKKRKPAPIRFDASPLLERFKDFEWAPEVTLDRIAICKMGAQKVFDSTGRLIDEAYEEIAARPLL